MDNIKLCKEAVLAREASYSPYSNYMVGAALLTKDGKVYRGCNVENSGYSPTICAERTAFVKAVSEGERHFAAIAVAGWPRAAAKPSQAFPCGVCRQVMREFCRADFKILVVKGKGGEHTEHTLDELFPHGFGPDSLND
jgi:cytidine deaminase